MNPLISFVISTRGRTTDVLATALFSIFDTRHNEQIEVVVVDQNRSEKIRDLCLNFKGQNVKYFSSDTVGLSRGRNIGKNLATGDWLWFFDDDASLSKDWLTLLEKNFIEKNNEAIIFYGMVYDNNGKKYLRRAANSKLLTRWQFDGVCSIGMVFNKKALEKVGEFDENFGVGSMYGAGEESGMVLRAFLKRVPVLFLKDLKAYHPRFARDVKKAGNYGFGIGALYKKYLFSSFFNFVVLVSKILLENFVRLFFVAWSFVVFDKELMVFHFSYLRGFWRGFFDFKI